MRGCGRLCQCGVVFGNPVFDYIAKLVGFLGEFVRIALAYKVGSIVAEFIAFGAAVVEVRGQYGSFGPECGLEGKERVVVGTAGLLDAIACGPDRHGGQRPGSVICHAEFSIDGESGKGGIVEISLGKSAELVKLLLGGRLGGDASLL